MSELIGPAFSPDGQQLAVRLFSFGGYDYGVHVVPAHPSAPTPVEAGGVTEVRDHDGLVVEAYRSTFERLYWFS